MHGPGVDENGKDIDECKNNAGMTLGICNNGRCVNMMKDYKCVCNSGFKNPSNTNRLCKGNFLTTSNFYAIGKNLENVKNEIGWYLLHTMVRGITLLKQFMLKFLHLISLSNSNLFPLAIDC